LSDLGFLRVPRVARLAEQSVVGIRLERIKPGHPQQNGRHELMHLTLKKEATKPAAKGLPSNSRPSSTRSSSATTRSGRIKP
jgi:hypothetical protein